MGRRRSQASDLDGVLIVDKPFGPTSHDVVAQVRRAARQSRAGHTGTLDPAATGVLVVCLGRCTRLVQFLQTGSKTYAARMVLGVETDTQDAQGVVVAETSASHIDERTLCEALTHLQGEIDQVPPMVSAVKVDGERLHVRARRGEEVVREPRRVTVHDLVLDAFVPGERPEVSFLVTCSPGTYVRTIAHDVGRALGVGGSLVSLRRLANGPFVAEEAHPLAEVDRHGTEGTLPTLLLDPLTAVSRVMPAVEVEDPALVRFLAQGGSLDVRADASPYAVHWHDRLVGIYLTHDGVGRPALVWTRPEEVS